MDELAPEARALLLLVSDGHEPPAGASERVWQAVTTDIAGGGGVGGTPAAGRSGLWSGGASSFMSKGGWIMALIAGAGLGAFLLFMPGSSARNDAQSAAKVAVPTGPVVATEAVRERDPNERVVESVSHAAASDADSSARALGSPTRRAQSQPADTLLQEVTALRRASEVLASDHPAKALALLRAHERRFRSGALREEREALVVLALCTQGSSAAQESAQTFLGQVPHAILRSRIEKACKLATGKP
jgi:hypothetical protein